MIYFQVHVDRIIAAKNDEIALLKSELTRLRQEFEIERKRANQAIDNLLMSKHLGTVAPLDPKKSKEAELVDSVISQMNLAGKDSE